MTRRWLECLFFFVGITGGHLSSEKESSFMSKDSSDRIVKNIAEVLQNLEHLTLLSDEKSYYKEIISVMEGIEDQISLFNRSSDSLNDLYRAFPNRSQFLDSFAFNEAVLYNLVNNINFDYNIMKFMVMMRTTTNNNSIHLRVTNWTMEHHRLIIPDGSGESILSQFLKVMNLTNHPTQLHKCSGQILQPQQYFAFEIWLTFVSSLLKGFAVDVLRNQYQYTIQNKTSDYVWKLTYSIIEKQKNVEECHQKYNDEIKNLLPGFRRNIENCDAEELKRDTNFIEVTRVFHPNVTFHDSCEGSVISCETRSIVNYGNFRNHTNVNETIHRKDGSVSVSVFEGQDRVCTCQENRFNSTKSTFIISSKLEEANVTNNMVVTGVRLRKKNRIIYTQIRQGELMAGGQIRQDTEEWKPVRTIKRSKIKNIINPIIISGRLKSVNLDDLQCPDDNHVVTGVGLRESKLKANMNRIVLTISCHPVNFERGILLPANGTGPREGEKPHPNKLEIGGLPPDKVHDAHQPDSSNDQFVEIGMSDIREDANQSVIPWFDAQNVVGTASVPLSGVGLYHRGAPDSGGFLAYRLLSIDYSLFVFPRKVPRVDPYAKERKVLMLAPPQRYCSGELARTLCIVCNGSYHSPSYHRSKRALLRLPRGISDECCRSKCTISHLEKYCGPFREDISELQCH